MVRKNVWAEKKFGARKSLGQKLNQGFFWYFPGGGWVVIIKIKANSVKLKLKLGLSLAIKIENLVSFF